MNQYSVGCWRGQPKEGVDLAPPLFKQRFAKDNWQFGESFDYTDEDFKDLPAGLNKLYQDTLKSKSMNLAIGGDHSIAAATVAANLEKHREDLHVIWIDAHADINTKRTSPSNNFHGMPVASLMNLENTNIIEGFTNFLKPNQITYIGIRDLDPGEIAFLKQHNIKAFWMKDITDISEVIDYLRTTLQNKKIHVSWDVDGLDPKYMPSTGTAVGRGLSMEESLKMCFAIRQFRENIVGVDLVEVNPKLGTDTDVRLTVENAYILLNALLR